MISVKIKIDLQQHLTRIVGRIRAAKKWRSLNAIEIGEIRMIEQIGELN